MKPEQVPEKPDRLNNRKKSKAGATQQQAAQQPLEITEFDDDQPEKPKSLWDQTKAFVEKQKTEFPLKYLHGPFGSVKPGTLVILRFEDDELIVETPVLIKRKEAFRIPLASITGTEVETAERMTIGRIGAGLLLAGPLGALFGGFGFKKKSKLLRLDFDDDGMGASIVFGKGAGKTVEQANGGIYDALREFRKRTGTLTSSSNNAAKPSTGTGDIATAIEKLAALKEQGILTEDEFTSKKAELLSRM